MKNTQLEKKHSFYRLHVFNTIFLCIAKETMYIRRFWSPVLTCVRTCAHACTHVCRLGSFAHYKLNADTINLERTAGLTDWGLSPMQVPSPPVPPISDASPKSRWSPALCKWFQQPPHWVGFVCWSSSQNPTELQETFYLGDHRFILKRCNSETARWKRCMGQNMWGRAWCFSPRLLGFTSQKRFKPHISRFLQKLNHKDKLIKLLAIGDLIQSPESPPS